MRGGTCFFEIFTNYEKKREAELSCINKYSTPLSQYFGEEPLGAIAALSLLGFVCISFAHLDLGIFSHSSLQICSSSVKLDGECQ